MSFPQQTPETMRKERTLRRQLADAKRNRSHYQAMAWSAAGLMVVGLLAAVAGIVLLVVTSLTGFDADTACTTLIASGFIVAVVTAVFVVMLEQAFHEFRPAEDDRRGPRLLHDVHTEVADAQERLDDFLADQAAEMLAEEQGK